MELSSKSITQPMDQDVICNLKAKYLTILVCHIIVAFDNSQTIPKSNILEAMNMLTRAWDQVLTTAIVNCIKKPRFQQHHRLKLSMIPTNHLVISDINLISLQDYLSLLDELISSLPPYLQISV